VACVQVPTTLLAMIDSAIGGKTGVDLSSGKNLVGAFWQPRFVLADPAALDTLPARELRAAYGEVVKYGLLGDAELFAALERGDEPPRAELILRCARLKAAVVSADEREQTGARATLNLGHTMGHAIEAASWKTDAPLLHGEAVALGLVAAARISARQGQGMCDGALSGRVAALLTKHGLAADLGPWLRDDVLAYVAVDKKRAAGKVRFVALEDVGRTRVVDMTVEELKAALL
jgi:3-dehydroquinate synthetase